MKSREVRKGLVIPEEVRGGPEWDGSRIPIDACGCFDPPRAGDTDSAPSSFTDIAAAKHASGAAAYPGSDSQGSIHKPPGHGRFVRGAIVDSVPP
eukprot:gene13786-biopygen13408